VSLGALSPADVKVQVLTGHVGPNRDLDDLSVHDLEAVEQGGEGVVFRGSIPCDRPGLRGYRVRVVPYHEGLAIPTELGLVTWERVAD
jgi:starch phosphorylase